MIFIGLVVTYKVNGKNKRGVIEALKLNGSMKVKIRGFDCWGGKWYPLAVVQGVRL